MIWGWDWLKERLLRSQHERLDGIEHRSAERISQADQATARAARLARQYGEMQQRGQLHKR